MSKKQRKAIEQLMNIIFVLGALLIWYLFFLDQWWGLFVALIVGVLITQVIMLFIPTSQPKRPRKKKISNKNASPIKNNSNITRSNRLLPDEEILKIPLQELSWREFERLCYLYYKAKGYKPRETKEGADGGVDLIIYNRHYKTDVAIQIKHYKNQITVREIRELNSAKRNHNCVLAEFITTSTYSNAALIEADNYKIKARNIDWVTNNIDKWRKNLVAK